MVIRDTRYIRNASRFVGRGEQGEVRTLDRPLFGDSRGDTVKIIHTNALERPFRHFVTWLIEGREISSIKKIKIQKQVTNIASILFPENIVDIHLVRFPRDIKPYSRDLDKLSDGERLPEIYMNKVYEPDDLKKLKATFYDFIESYKSKAEKMTFNERQIIFAQLQTVKKSIDERIRALYPEVVVLAKKINDAGFLISHPEVNFGIRTDSNGNKHIVFYDIFPHLDIPKLLNYVLTNPQISESQRKIVMRKLAYFKHIDAKERDLIPIRDVAYKSITDEGKKELKGILGIDITSPEQMHQAIRDIYTQVVSNGNLLRQILDRGLNTDGITGKMNTRFVQIGKYKFSAGIYGDKILVYLNMNEDLFVNLTQTNIGLPVIEISKERDPRITLLNFNYLYENKLINFSYR